MPKQFKAARLWTAVAVAVLIAGTVSAMDHAGTRGAPVHFPTASTAI